MADKADVVLIGVPKKLIVDALSGPFNLHVAAQGRQRRSDRRQGRRQCPRRRRHRRAGRDAHAT